MARAKPCGRAGRRPGWTPGQGRRGRTAPRLSHHPGVPCRGISHLETAEELEELLRRREDELGVVGEERGRLVRENGDAELVLELLDGAKRIEVGDVVARDEC